MKKITILVLTILLLTVTVLNAQVKRGMKTQFKNDTTQDVMTSEIDNNITTFTLSNENGILINGVRWATCNVDAPGTFVSNPKDAGMFYQWNRKVGWSSTDPLVNSNGGTTWDSSIPTGNKWEKVNDPCPTGWCVPTISELKSIVDSTFVTTTWTIENGVNGRRCTDKSTGQSIFLPAAGSRNPYSTLELQGVCGFYWSSTCEILGTTNADILSFSNGGMNTGFIMRHLGNSVRCVKIEDIGDDVLINGVRWATRNIDMPGTFATKPESFGMFYQWNRKVGWSSTDPLVNSNGGTTWNSSFPTGNTWESVNDPCPSGYRVPSISELSKLLEVSSVWEQKNGVYGRTFGSGGNTIFLPAVGIRYYVNGELGYQGLDGYYWSNTPNGSAGSNLHFYSSDIRFNYNNSRAGGHCVRCVKIENVGVSENKISDIMIYPNPTIGQFTITNLQLPIENIEIFDIYGRFVRAYPCSRPETTINISHLSTGMYFIKIRTDAGEIVRKIVKE